MRGERRIDRGADGRDDATIKAFFARGARISGAPDEAGLSRIPQGDKMKTIAEVVGDKNNHFNLMRMVAAAGVLVGHNGALLNLKLPYEEFINSYRVFTGGVTVDVFFAISGFLVTASLFNRGSVISFLCARALRIFPGLWTMLLLITFGLGLCLTTVPVAEYLTSPVTWRFLWKWGTVLNGFANDLPGLFQNSPYDQKVNASLWTISVEWRLYLILALCWFVLTPVPFWRKTIFRIAMPIIAAVIYYQITTPQIANLGGQHSFCFFAGSTLFLYGEKIPVGPRPLLATLGVFVLAAVLSKPNFFYVYVALLPYLVLNLAYTPNRLLLNYNRLGDYSYGLYIYAYPISQAMLALKPGIGLVEMTLWSAPPSFLAAILSWRFIEKPALAQKEALAAFVTRKLTRISPVFADGWSPFQERPWRKLGASAPLEAERREPAS
jgi:peptidoglycan/LPS O-acetylase OafA/YrhL